MTISVPLIAVIAALVYVAWRYMGLRTWQIVLCLVFGFLLAATSAAPAIQRAITSIVGSLTGR